MPWVPCKTVSTLTYSTIIFKYTMSYSAASETSTNELLGPGLGADGTADGGSATPGNVPITMPFTRSNATPTTVRAVRGSLREADQRLAARRWIVGAVSVNSTSRSKVSSTDIDCVGRSGTTSLSSTPRASSYRRRP